MDAGVYMVYDSNHGKKNISLSLILINNNQKMRQSGKEGRNIFQSTDTLLSMIPKGGV